MLLSFRCRQTLLADFRTFGYSTDIIERLNSQLSLKGRRRGPCQSFANSSRESLLRQALDVHKASGGWDPLTSKAAVNSHRNVVSMHPLIAHSSSVPAIADGAAYPASSSALVATPAVGDACEMVAANTALLPSSLAPATSTRASTQRQGLSPYMLELNKTLADRKRLKGKSLTADEVAEVRPSFREQWGALQDREAFRES